MTDIVERLRAGFFCREEAAAEIERLRTALEEITECYGYQAVQIARAALTPADCHYPNCDLINCGPCREAARAALSAVGTPSNG